MTTTEPLIQAAAQAGSAPRLPLATSRLILAGFMGAGKSTIGQALAERLGWAFLDLDRHIEHRAQTTVPELFARCGEPHFRRLESSALASALSLTSTVIALGGGTPEIHTNRLLLEQTPGTLTVFLDAPFPVLFDRCVLQSLTPGTTDRPLLRDPSTALERFRARHPLYRRLARITQQTEDLNPGETVDAILQRFLAEG